LLDTSGFRKLPALDSKAAIREKREKEIQMKVCSAQKCFSFVCPSLLISLQAQQQRKNSQRGIRGLLYSYFCWGLLWQQRAEVNAKSRHAVMRMGTSSHARGQSYSKKEEATDGDLAIP
jgi:hypothetical protein